MGGGQPHRTPGVRSLRTGRPKVDEIEVRFIPDPNALMANVLAGVEMSIGRALSLDQALRVGEQWRDGRVAIRPYGWVTVVPQFVNPSPSLIADLRFRQALLEGINRQELVDSLMAPPSPGRSAWGRWPRWCVT